MNLVEQAEVESLKKQYIFLTDLLKKHQTHEACYQRPQFHNNIPYRNSNQSLYSKTKTVRPSKFNNLNVYKSKCHVNMSSSGNIPNVITSRNFTERSYSHKLTPVSVLPKQSASYSAKQAVPYKYNKISSCTQNCSTSSFKTVRTLNGAKVSKLNSAEGTEFDNSLKPAAISDSSKNSLPSGKNDLQPSKLTKGTKVSYLSCSDCVIEISEYANGELHITQKKAEPCVENKQNYIRKSDISSDFGISRSLLSDVDYEKSTAMTLDEMVHVDSLCNSEQNSVYSKPLIGLESHTVSLDSYAITDHLEYTGKAIDNSVVKREIKLAGADLMLEREFISSPCKLTKSQPLCARNAKYSKINASPVKSAAQNSVARQLLKSKYSVKKSNVMKCNSKSKCKMNREVKKCVPHPVKYTYVAKSSTSPKSLVSSVSKRTVLSPAKYVDRSVSYASCSQPETYGQSHGKSVPLQHKIHYTKSDLAISSYARISRKTKALHLKNVYKVVNKNNPVTSRIIAKNSSLRKTLCEKGISSPLPKCDHGSDKKWSANVTSGSNNVTHHTLNVTPHKNFPDNHLTKSVSKEMIYKSRTAAHKTGYKLKNMLNGSKIITRHSLQRIPQKRNVIKKPSSSPLHKSFLDSLTPIKKAKKVRLSKTTYKVVNKHVSHVSQVVQMIKTKYRTVNKRSASNSHLKWLHEQKKTYLKRKLQKSLIHTKGRWTYNHSVSAEHFRKHPMLRSKTSRKQSLGQRKVLKEIRGITYKVSKTKINKSVNPKTVKKSCFTSLQQRNKIPLSRIKIGCCTYSQQKESQVGLVRFSSQTRNLASRMLHRSIHTIRAAATKKTMQKSNMFCMFFNRFGRCNKEGNCSYIHDPSKIAVCPRFLRGTCKIDGCPFSHEVSPGKMAICSFFLQGNCTNSNCPYQHTSIRPGTRLCKAFVKGYCYSGSQCQDAHILACPQLICEGFCEKGSSCTWPHPPVKKGIKKGSGLSEVNKEIREENEAVDDISDLRYFTYEPGLVSDQCIKQVESLEDSTHINKKIPKIRNKKKKFHKQPEFIPLHVSNEEF